MGVNEELYKEKLALIRDKIIEIDYISNNANLLAINATIEVMHASELLNAFEQVVSSNLLIQSCLMAELLNAVPDILFESEEQFSQTFGVEDFYITDGNGTVEFSNLAGSKGNPLPTPEFLKILDDPQLRLSLPSAENPVDKRQYKVVGVARRDVPGIIQMGSHYVGAAGQTAINGFGAVTEEAKRLADLINLISDDMLKKTSEIFAGDDNSLIREYADGIRESLSRLTNLARQTNLLGINALIEAAHSTNEQQDFDNLLNYYMITEARLAAYLIENKRGLTCEDMAGLSQCSGIGEFWITDERGVVELTNVEGGKGFAFSNEGQTGPYMAILANPELIVTAPPSRRTLDNRIFKFAAVGRRDKKGIFQIGIPSKLYGDSTTKGFNEVAKQIKTLAEQLKCVIDEIDRIVIGLNN
ncbi:hypothetical protein MASR2M70_06450 [Bacillota bacterium]